MHGVVPIIASAFFGAGIYIVILAVLNYIVDSYGPYSASALAGVILVRNVVGAVFPLFASQMYHKLGNEWASTLLAFLSLLFAVRSSLHSDSFDAAKLMLIDNSRYHYGGSTVANSYD